MTRSSATTGPWHHVPQHIAEGPSEVRHADGWLVCETCSDEYARLIAEAGTVLHETGLSPRELANERDRLREALKGAAVVANISGRLIAEIETAVTEAHEYFDNKSDVNDGDYGIPEPNREMQLAQLCSGAIASLGTLTRAPAQREPQPGSKSEGR